MPEPNELLNIFGIFLLVLVGIELVYTLKTYLTENALHVEVVLMAALIAIGRKVIILDVIESNISNATDDHHEKTTNTG